ncbi:MAG: hypothetical protein ACPG4N_00020 [Gammaproteobacteria bacterium]
MANKAVRMMQQSPLPEMVEMLGSSIADAQFALDLNAIDIAQRLGSEEFAVRFHPEGESISLLELGFAPTFYAFTEATIEARVTFSMGVSHEVGVKVGATVGYPMVWGASVEASYTGKYSFDATASSSVTTRMVTVPAPSQFTERLKQERRRQRLEAEAQTDGDDATTTESSS